MSEEPALRLHMNLMALDSMPPSSSAPRGDFGQRLEVLVQAGFSGVQFVGVGSAEERARCRALNMGVAASGRVNNAQEAAAFAEQVAGGGLECATVHAGWGMEDDDEAGRLLEGILNASARWRVPLYVETHRATICQDMWRTVQFVKRFPDLRFNGDFSHWYAGQEMVYGGFEKKLAFIAPVIERVRFLHGRIASPGCIQVVAGAAAGEEPLYVEHFRAMWTAVFRAFQRDAEAPPFICFTPELLGPDIYYARTFGGNEESDRWQESLLLARIARQCFDRARSS